MTTIQWVFDDGGRKAAGFSGRAAGDCVARSIAIATGKPYGDVYRELNAVAKRERTMRGKVGLAAATGRGSSARTGIRKVTERAYLESLGWRWTPTMRIGSGCTVHLRADELPGGRLIVALSRHMTAVIDGVIRDIYDPSRDGTRCVYGYWSAPETP